jgi:hypothetical protein
VERSTVTPAVSPEEETPGQAALLTVVLVKPNPPQSPGPAAALVIKLGPDKGDATDLPAPRRRANPSLCGPDHALPLACGDSWPGHETARAAL